MLRTERLTLHPWDERHRADFVALHADAEVMADLGGAYEPAESHAKFERYRAGLRRYRTSRWAVETNNGRFIGYAGVMYRPDRDHPLGAHFDVGWRFARDAWGYGYATESARASLVHAFGLFGAIEVLSYARSDNPRSHAVMGRLGLERAPARDFSAHDPRIGAWRGFVWQADASLARRLARPSCRSPEG